MTPAYRAQNVRLVRDPRTGRFVYARPMVMVGALPPTAPQPPAQDTQPTADESFSMADLSKAFTHAITPTLIVVGIATGAAFAIGSGLVSRYLFKDHGR